MISIRGADTTSARRLLVALGLAVSLGACDLEVTDPAVVREPELTGAIAIPTRINGMVGDMIDAVDNYVLYTGLFNDEFILAGTFPTREEVDFRNILVSNATVSGDVLTPIQVARRSADQFIVDFTGVDVGEDQALVNEGLGVANYVSGIHRFMLGIFFCEMPLAGPLNPTPEGQDPTVFSDDELIQASLPFFQEAETAAAAASLDNFKYAAIMGQARVALWQRDFVGAAGLAAQVPDGHRLLIEHSNNDPEQFNGVFDLTWGSQNAVIRWTVGDGSEGTRGLEKFAEFDEFVALDILIPNAPLNAFNANIEVHAQRLYDEEGDDIAFSSGIHARLIEAEAALRAGNVDMAETIINEVRASWQTRWSSERFQVDDGPDPIDLSGNTLDQNLRILASERAREAWLVGDRHETLRRLLADGIDLFPDKSAFNEGGDQVCAPIPEDELDGAVPEGV